MSTVSFPRFATRAALCAAALAVAAVAADPASAQSRSIVDEWADVKAPAAPELKPAKLDPKETALLVLDIIQPLCPPRPRCVAAVPRIKALLERTRAAGATVIYATAGQPATDILADVAPRAGEPTVASGPDKFMNTELDKLLKDRGIKHVIVVGTAAEGAVLNTSARAALLGYRVAVAVDGIASVNPYSEQYTVWHLGNSPRVGPQVTLTRSDLIAF